MVGLEQQVGEFKRSLALLQATLESTTDGILVTDNDGIVTGFNAKYAGMWKFSPEDLQGARHFDLMNHINKQPRDPDAYRRRMEEIYATTPAETHDLLELADGRVMERFTKILKVDDEKIGRVWCYQDVTRQKIAETDLRKANDTLESKVQERTAELTHVIERLHDEISNRERLEASLRERTIQLQVMAAELTLAEQRERHRLAILLHDNLQQLLTAAKISTSIIERSRSEAVPALARELSGLISECIEASRTLTGELSPPILREGGLVPALEWLARWEKEKHGLDVEVKVLGEVEVDREDLNVLLFQCVRELLFNIVKHAGVGRGYLEVDSDEREVIIRVSDEGAGFDREAMLGCGAKEGFGIFAIRERLDILGGKMCVESSPRKGCCFTLTVPREHHSAHGALTRADKPEREGKCHPSDDAGLFRKLRVMLVDDHKVVRQALSEMLKNEPDIEVVGGAADGESALHLVPQLQPDVVLMDISMPRMSGIEATRLIRTQHPTVQVIALSMFDEADRANAMREAGATLYLNKSGPVEAVVGAIRGTRAAP